MTVAHLVGADDTAVPVEPDILDIICNRLPLFLRDEVLAGALAFGSRAGLRDGYPRRAALHRYLIAA